MSEWAAFQLWGEEAVRAALAEVSPDSVTAELVRETQTYVDRPGVLRSWAVAQPWPRFCAIVRIISGTVLSETMEDD